MKIRELIAELQDFDPEREVLCSVADELTIYRIVDVVDLDLQNSVMLDMQDTMESTNDQASDPLTETSAILYEDRN